jgi:hypothetical protein
MSALVTSIKTLLASPGVVALCENRIHPIGEPDGTKRPNIIIYIISSNEGYHMAGANSYPDSRISVECRGIDAPSVDRLGDAVVAALSGTQITIGGVNAVYFKEGGDIQDVTPDYSVFRRIIDFNVRTR